MPSPNPYSTRSTIRWIIFAVVGLNLLHFVVEGSGYLNAQNTTDFWSVVSSVGLITVVVVGITWAMKRAEHSRFIDHRLNHLLDGLGSFRAYSKVLPRYRFVDLYHAASAMTRELDGWVELEAAHLEPLAMILNRRFYQLGNRRSQPAERAARTVGPGKEEYFPKDCFWVWPAAMAARRAGDAPCVIRLRQGPAPHQTTLEVAARTPREGTALIERLVRQSTEKSIYRNGLLDLEFSGEVRDEEGNIEQNENLDLVFKSSPRIRPEDIVMEDDVTRALERNVLDFHRRRDTLMSLGLPGRRGVLLYGPPGTGKTYTSKYLASQLAGSVTTLVASGESLLRVRTICNLARMLQPSLVVLEDVDLVYASRESGAGHNASLGKLMDELDGFGRDDRIVFILTTNAIDRVERAISDRPGRISQCVFLGPPSDPLRRRYLRALLAPYDGRTLDLDRLAGATGGTTQAFLKELVFRAVQIASLGLPASPGPETNGRKAGSAAAAAGQLMLRDEHFTAAMTEMRAAGGRAGETIIGFRAVGF